MKEKKYITIFSKRKKIELDASSILYIIMQRDKAEIHVSGDLIPGGETDKVPDSQPAQTGDDSMPELWIAFLLISGCVGCGSALYGRRKRIM